LQLIFIFKTIDLFWCLEYLKHCGTIERPMKHLPGGSAVFHFSISYPRYYMHGAVEKDQVNSSDFLLDYTNLLITTK